MKKRQEFSFMPSVQIFWSEYNELISETVRKEFEIIAPSSMRLRADAYKYSRDAQLYMLGKLLLHNGLRIIGNNNLGLDSVVYNQFSCPYFGDGPNFNISHSGSVVVCAISANCGIGIDIEQLRDIDVTEFKDFFTANEFKMIAGTLNPMDSFFTLWTKKESLFKGLRMGLNIPLTEFDVSGPKVDVNKKRWFFKELFFKQGYKSYLSFDCEQVEITLCFVPNPALT